MLSAHDHKIIAEALSAAAEGPFFPDWEFHTLFGLEREATTGTPQVPESI